MRYVIYNKETGKILQSTPVSDIDLIMDSDYDDSAAYITVPDNFNTANHKVDPIRKRVVLKESNEDYQRKVNISKMRQKRNMLLQESDWVELPSNVNRFGPELSQQWHDYRQALRDMDFTNPVWPLKP